MWSHRSGGIRNLVAAFDILLQSISSPMPSSALKSLLIPYPGALGAMINAGEGPGLGKDSVHHSSGQVTQGVGGFGSS